MHFSVPKNLFSTRPRLDNGFFLLVDLKFIFEKIKFCSITIQCLGPIQVCLIIKTVLCCQAVVNQLLIIHFEQSRKTEALNLVNLFRIFS